MKHTCKWVLKDKTYCGKPVSYKIILDDDRNKMRQYDTWCAEHKVRAAQEQDNCEEEV
jgi:hypothetical protein